MPRGDLELNIAMIPRLNDALDKPPVALPVPNRESSSRTFRKFAAALHPVAADPSKMYRLQRSLVIGYVGCVYV